ncbi:hypothetical protein E2562_020591 [Oryza meyeriana var. granulata]|uniref:Uncharacterized protein n=1 Tax=Oryza meyeriana var. granulata TaxID=110450 RepID=A0A6G1DX88_9ORYZ|nr:hypothetical protein E2562_020591 [Oryza meyeriana var. granulata]
MKRRQCLDEEEGDIELVGISPKKSDKVRVSVTPERSGLLLISIEGRGAASCKRNRHWVRQERGVVIRLVHYFHF